MGISTEYSSCPHPPTPPSYQGPHRWCWVTVSGTPSLSDQQHALWGLRDFVGGIMADFGEGVWFSRSGTLLISPSLTGSVPLGPLLQTLTAGPQHPGLLPYVLKDTFQGQAPRERPQLSPVPWLGAHLFCFLIAVAACAESAQLEAPGHSCPRPPPACLSPHSCPLKRVPPPKPETHSPKREVPLRISQPLQPWNKFCN